MTNTLIKRFTILDSDSDTFKQYTVWMRKTGFGFETAMPYAKTEKNTQYNFVDISRFCVRMSLQTRAPITMKSFEGRKLLRRFAVFFFVCILMVGVFYCSLIFTASPLDQQEQDLVDSATKLLEKRGFINEAFLLRDLATFRNNDNWLNATVPKENAFAATNYPFAIITLYPDFFTYPTDDTERAAILLHEARHLKGYGEEDAYEFVWRNRKYLGWTAERYAVSVVWQNIRHQTKEYAPNLFVCDFNQYGDCTD